MAIYREAFGTARSPAQIDTGGIPIPAYITLINWTDQGARNAKDTVQRYEAAESAAMKMGVEFKSFHWTMGAYDAVGVVDAPDDAAVSRFLLATATLGNVRTTTMRAYGKDEMTQILKGMPQAATAGCRRSRAR